MLQRVFFSAFLCALCAAGCTPRRDLGNALRVALREKVKTLDPAHSNDYFSGIGVMRAYEGLYQYHYLKRPYEIELSLAEKLPLVSKDGLLYTIPIKKGVLFHDDACFPERKGRELVARDFIYSWMRIADPRELSEVWWTLDGRIAGLNEWREKVKRGEIISADYNEEIEGLKALDDHTLQIKLTRADPLFLHILAMPATSAVASEAVRKYGKDLTTKAVGTGPFRLERFESNKIAWVRHAGYHQERYPSEGGPGDEAAGLLEDAGKPLPFIDRLVDDIIPEDQPAWLNFLQGNQDYLMKIPKDNARTVFSGGFTLSREMQERGIRFFTSPGVEFSYIAFNQADPVVGGPGKRFLRQAISLAYDEAPTIEMFYLGLGVKAESMIPPGVFGYDPAYKNPWREFNVAKAKEILAKNGHPGGRGIPELIYDLRSDPTARQVAEYFARSMAKIGISVKLNAVSWPELSSRIAKKQAQVWGGIVWVYDYPDPENGLQLLYGPNQSPGPNKTNYKNAEYDRLFEKFVRTSGSSEKMALIGKMRALLERDLPWIPAVHRNENRLAHAWLRNLKINAFQFNMEKYLRVDAEARKRMAR